MSDAKKYYTNLKIECDECGKTETFTVLHELESDTVRKECDYCHLFRQFNILGRIGRTTL